MTLYPHQIQAIEEAQAILHLYKFVYIFGEPRIGKSLIALELAKQSKAKQTIIITKKNAIKDWQKYNTNYVFDIVNYESLHKKNPSAYDFVIVDEAHNYGKVGKANLRIKRAVAFCKQKPIVFLSGTPFVESPLRIFYQFALSSFSPFPPNFYTFFRIYGIPNPIYLYGKSVETYTKAKPELLQFIDKYIVRVKHNNYQNFDNVIYIDKNNEYTVLEKNIYNGYLVSKDEPFETASAQWMCAHRMEGGYYNGVAMAEAPKVRWLLEFCNTHANASICVMAYFIEEQEALTKLLPTCQVLSSTKYCEGVDLSHFDYYILYSFGYSGAKFVQLRDRIVNINNNKATQVLIPLVKGGFCEKVYKCVSNKKNFNIRMLNKNIKNMEKF